MKGFQDLLTPFQERRLRAVDAWHHALENINLRMDRPDAHNDELFRQSDEMYRLGVVTWTEWRDLRTEADKAYIRAVGGESYHRRVL